ncbi:DUF2933 domain-containing protein [Paraburkholderia dipogonis]|uniref:DUF2933 domain-containing protein n=1 Tax=Paraburkholderia dipogonis TaxID=1211383 RepID=UPI0038B9DF04
MKRNAKAIVAAASGLVALVVLAYWALPQFQGSVLNLIVFACLVICPLSMLFMMRGKRSDRDKSDHQD